MTTCPLHISSHALERFRERFDWAKPFSNHTLTLLLRHMHRQAVKIGIAQVGVAELLQSPSRDHCGPVVIVVGIRAECHVILTVLTHDQAMSDFSRRTYRPRSTSSRRRFRRRSPWRDRFDPTTNDDQPRKRRLKHSRRLGTWAITHTEED